MKTKVISLFILFFAVTMLFMGCGGSNATIKLGDVNPAFAKYASQEKYDGVMNTVEYDVTGVEKYDQFFFKTAKLLATTKQLSFAIDKLKSSGDILTKVQSVMKGSLDINTLKAGKETFEEVSYFLETVQFAQTSVPNMINEAKTLAGSATSFSPQSDFTGLDARKVPSVAASLANATGSLASAATELGGILTKISSLK